MERSTYGDCFQLRQRLIGGALLPYACQECGISEWRGRPLVLQLDHRNGVGDDHRLENLRLLRPNCHSHRETYRAHYRPRESRAEGCRGRDSNPHGVSPNGV